MNLPVSIPTIDMAVALRDLSVSLEKVGDIAHAQGRLDAARAACEESLALRRRLIAEGGETLRALDDLLHALTRNRELATSTGDVAAAERTADDKQ